MPLESGPSMSDAEARFGERLAVDLERVLGEGVIVNEFELGADGSVVVRVVCLVDGQIREFEATAASILDAQREIVRTAAELRLSAAWWQIVGPT